MSIFFLKTDPHQLLYHAEIDPKIINKVIPNAVIPSAFELLTIYEKIILAAEVVEMDWFYCPISSEIPTVPLCFADHEVVSYIYNKKDLEQWFSSHQKDPCGLSQNVTIANYKTPTPEQILNFVVTGSKLPRELFITEYRVDPLDFLLLETEPKNEDNGQQRDALLVQTDSRNNAASHSDPSYFSGLFNFFCCWGPPDETSPSHEERSSLLL